VETDEHHPQPIPRDPDLPDISDGTLMLFAAVALTVTVIVLVLLLD
jgi:hypothetical protein